jgi:CubicO group peptidase (beta-lactamase class C family)
MMNIHIRCSWGLVLLLGVFASIDRVHAADEVWPSPAWQSAKPDELGLDATRLEEARRYALTGEGSGYIIRGGKLVLSWGDPRKRYDLKSTTKSFGATALGVAILDGKVALSDRARKHLPDLGVPPESNADTGWLDEITLQHLATQTAGFEKPGGFGKLLFKPGAKWAYSDGGPNWLADCLTKVYGRDLDALMFERVFTPLGITRQDLVWRPNSYRPKQLAGIERREFGAGISANVDAMARVGYLYLRQGRWKEERLLPADFVKQAGSALPALAELEVLNLADYGHASAHYGLLWWNNADGTLQQVPRDAFWAWGLYDSLILVIPSLDIVAARAGNSWKREPNGGHYDVLRPFFEPIALSVKGGNKPPADDLLERKSGSESRRPGSTKAAAAPYPQSKVITGIEWASVAEIVRRAKGSDTWPTTWADDDRQYTAFGDGKGFEPLIDVKLSLGLARITGGPGDFTAENLRAPTLEQLGDGPRGKKASGMLMVDGVLSLLVRNAGNSQLARSTDHGRTWEWSDWKFSTSFGCPTFLNFGRNYAGARDEFAYVYSHDHDSAYQPADRMVLARVPMMQIADRASYRFFAGLAEEDQPRWSADIADRAAVFEHPGRCYRSSITWNPGLRRYLWCQTMPGEDPRFAGGFGIYDAPEPWGPWTTVFFTEYWDVGPGETQVIPAKWISNDGRTIRLVFSGDDCFSVRRAQLSVAE